MGASKLTANYGAFIRFKVLLHLFFVSVHVTCLSIQHMKRKCFEINIYQSPEASQRRLSKASSVCVFFFFFEFRKLSSDVTAPPTGPDVECRRQRERVVFPSAYSKFYSLTMDSFKMSHCWAKLLKTQYRFLANSIFYLTPHSRGTCPHVMDCRVSNSTYKGAQTDTGLMSAVLVGQCWAWT